MESYFEGRKDDINFVKACDPKGHPCLEEMLVLVLNPPLPPEYCGYRSVKQLLIELFENFHC